MAISRAAFSEMNDHQQDLSFGDPTNLIYLSCLLRVNPASCVDQGLARARNFGRVRDSKTNCAIAAARSHFNLGIGVPEASQHEQEVAIIFSRFGVADHVSGSRDRFGIRDPSIGSGVLSRGLLFPGGLPSSLCPQLSVNVC